MTATPTERPHGYARYKLNRCRCNTCRAAVSAYNRKTAMATTAGTWQPYTDAEPVRQHVRAAKAAGIGWRRVAELAGVPRSTVKQLLYGKPGRPPTRQIRPAVAERLLAVHFGPWALADGALVAATGVRRRIQALAWLGWSLSEQARRIGWSVGNYATLLERPQVTRATADKVCALYEQLSMIPAADGYSATRSRNLAAARGWLPPLAWDDDNIDEPKARPRGQASRAVAA
jgi:hypothetical protein